MQKADVFVTHVVLKTLWLTVAQPKPIRLRGRNEVKAKPVRTKVSLRK